MDAVAPERLPLLAALLLSPDDRARLIKNAVADAYGLRMATGPDSRRSLCRGAGATRHVAR